MSCCATKLIEIPQCALTITMPTGLPQGNYTTILTDKFGNQYRVLNEVDENGQLVINTNEYPSGLLSKYAGLFTFEMYYGCSKVDIVQCDTEYSALTFKIVSVDNWVDNFDVCCQ